MADINIASLMRQSFNNNSTMHDCFSENNMIDRAVQTRLQRPESMQRPESILFEDMLDEDGLLPFSY